MIPSAPSVHSARKSPGAHRLCGHPERARHAHPPQARTRDASWNREPRRRPPAFPDPRTPAEEALSQLPVGPSAAGTCSFRPRSPAHGGGSTARLSGRGFSEVVGLAAIARTQCARSQSESGAVAGAAADHLPVCYKRLDTPLVLRGGRSAHRTSRRAALLLPNKMILAGTGMNPAPGRSCQRQMERRPGRPMPKGMAAADSRQRVSTVSALLARGGQASREAQRSRT